MTNEKMLYSECLELLSDAINTKTQNKDIDSNTKTLFYFGLVSLKDLYGITLSSKFLRGLCSNGDNAHKSNRINYLLKECGLTKKHDFEIIESVFSCESGLKDVYDFERKMIKQKDGTFKEVIRKTAYTILKENPDKKSEVKFIPFVVMPFKTKTIVKANIIKHFNIVNI
jgi:hypothetical protein